LPFHILVACAEQGAVTNRLPEPSVSFGDPLELGGVPLLDPVFTPRETYDLRTSFDWATTVALPEVDATSGGPSLYYAIVYISDPDQIDGLEAMELPVSALPLFDSERDRWTGLRGQLQQIGDGEGVFQFVVLPAHVYNVIRELSLDGRPPIGPVILRDPPSEFANVDGSLSYQALSDAGFRLSWTAPDRDRTELRRGENFITP